VRVKQAWEKEGNLNGYGRQFLHVDFGQQEESWVLGKSTNHASHGNITYWVEFDVGNEIGCL
jgi:hypothetical protein